MKHRHSFLTQLLNGRLSVCADGRSPPTSTVQIMSLGPPLPPPLPPPPSLPKENLCSVPRDRAPGTAQSAATPAAAAAAADAYVYKH